jgi:hypothetical protein
MIISFVWSSMRRPVQLICEGVYTLKIEALGSSQRRLKSLLVWASVKCPRIRMAGACGVFPLRKGRLPALVCWMNASILPEDVGFRNSRVQMWQ